MCNFEVIEPGSAHYENLRHTYLKNHTALKLSFPEVARNLEDVDFSCEILCKDNEFRYGLVNIGKKDNVIWLTDYDTIPERQKAFLREFQSYDHIIFLGVGIGEYLLLLADLPKEQKFPEIWILEPEPVWLKAALSFIDLHDFWNNMKLHLIVGEKWEYLFDKEAIGNISGKKCVLLQNPTRKLSRYRDVLIHVLKMTAGNTNVFFCDGNCSDPIIPLQLTQQQKNIFAKNFNILKKYQHFYCDLEAMAEVRDANSILYSNRNGHIGVLIEKEDKRTFLPLGGNDPSMVSILNCFEKEYSVDNTYMIVGSGDGKALQSVLHMSDVSVKWKGFAQIVYLVDLHPKIFAASLCFHDFSKYLEQQRFRIFLGKNALFHLVDYFNNDPQARRPNKYYIDRYYTATGLADKVEDCFREIHRYEAEKSEALFRELAEFYAGMSVKQWKRKFEAKKIKILLITTRQSSFVQYSTRDLMAGFQENNCECKLIIEKDGLSSLTILYIIEQLFTYKPDLIVVINHLRDESRQVIPHNIPYVCWIQDPSYNIFDNERLKINTFERVYCISNKWIQSLKGKDKYMNVDIKFLPLGVNHQIYKPLWIQKHFDVTYISHLSHPKDLFKRQVDVSPYSFDSRESRIIKENEEGYKLIVDVYKKLSEEIHAKEIAELNFLVSEDNRRKYLCDFFRKNNVRFDELLAYLVSFRSRLWNTIEANIKYRSIVVLMKNGFHVGVWGANWDEYPETKRIAMGPAENGAEINKIQNQSKISLNNSILLSFHMKAMEIMASKSFMLTRKNPYDIENISHHFKEGEEFVYFHSENDLVEKTAFYIDNPAERERIAENAYMKVIGKYTYNMITKMILDDCRNHFQRM